MNITPPGEGPTADEQGVESKTYNEDDLLDGILKNGEAAGWSKEQVLDVLMAFDFAKHLHAGRRHRKQPYVYHVLRNASRILNRLNISDPELIVAELLHDSVEDHAALILEVDAEGFDPAELQEQALILMDETFSVREAKIIRGMTNPVEPPYEDGLSEAKKEERSLKVYVEHMRDAIKDIDVWICKFVDWVDNGVNLHKAEKDVTSGRLIYLARRYLLALDALEERFEGPDIQQFLDEDAKKYVREMFMLGRERLTKILHESAKNLGSVAVTNTQEPPMSV